MVSIATSVTELTSEASEHQSRVLMHVMYCVIPIAGGYVFNLPQSSDLQSLLLPLMGFGPCNLH